MTTKPRVKVTEKHEDGTETPVPLVDALTETLPDGTVVPMESNPTCERCGHTFAEPREGKVCCVCLEKDKPALPPGAPGSPQARPTLDVAIETHRNLRKRVEALCGRLMAWDTKGLAADLHGCAEVMVDNCRAMGYMLAEAQRTGFVAKTTPKSRIEARLASHQPVKLREDVRAIWKAYYSEEELDQVEVRGRDEVAGLVWVKLGKREASLPIPVKLSQLLAG